MAILREVFDGHVERYVGTRDEALAWAGKVGLVAGVTEEIEAHRATIGVMGERFLYVPIGINQSPSDRAAAVALAAGNAGRAASVRDRLARHVAEFFARLAVPIEVAALPEPEAAWLATAADLGSGARSPVLRDSRSREIDLVPEPEIGARLVGELTQLWRGLRLIGASQTDARRVAQAAILSGIPKIRRMAFLALLEADGPLRTVQVSARTRVPHSTVHRVLEDLAALGLVDSDQLDGTRAGAGSMLWSASRWTAQRWNQLTAYLPARSG